MEIDVRKEGQTVVISLTGRMDAVSAPQFDMTAEELLAQGDRRLIINFETLEYISSAGLQSILALAKRLEPVDGSVVLCNLNGPVKEVFDISGFSFIFNIYDNLEDAKASG
ncbi:MAG TPA: STAS domain-containing protein [Syntrophales bacterium]|jgi:anti-anti-sigma factor|nr:STAS domain-containing protein [Syntrophales bacterium]HON23391.1 STAS domain-containing protein [Syntrophales bacterium]HOU77599.1 STAS domain-containing protein [Syntrophales bacterium]HPC32388.1 STAS domain-containing protein [Syntrophales bacterium]HQG34623.1 STAS domain-containing protein [Syntrophales bacterium]